MLDSSSMVAEIGAWAGITSPGVKYKSKKVGVGIKNIKDFNMALLCKWLWRLGVENSGMWLHLIRQRHYSRAK